MDKVSMNNTNIETAHSPNTRDATPPVATPSFSNGELGQLQEILFGQQQRSTNEQMIALQKQFDTQINTLSNVLNSRLNQLTETVEKSQKHIEQKFNEIKMDNKSALETLNKNVKAANAKMHTDINTLSSSTNEDTKRLHTEIAQHESKLLSRISDTKHELQTDIDHSINGLHSTKLDKQDLVQLLNSLSDKLSNTLSTE